MVEHGPSIAAPISTEITARVVTLDRLAATDVPNVDEVLWEAPVPSNYEEMTGPELEAYSGLREEQSAPMESVSF